METDDLQAQVDALRWYHTIDLGHGVITKGVDNTPERLARVQLPTTLSGRSVLDIGAWDGFFSFEAERRDAGRVVACDYYSWQGTGWGTLQGKAGFELARKALGSHVEDVDLDVLDLSPERIGTFDVVLLLGVLYHLRNPLMALERVASVTRELFTNWWGPNQAAVCGMLRAVGFKRIRIMTKTRSAAFRAARAIVHRVKGKNDLASAFRQDRAVFHASKE